MVTMVEGCPHIYIITCVYPQDTCGIQFLRISLTNFLWRNVDNTNGQSLTLPSRTFVNKSHKISKEIDDNRTRNSCRITQELFTTTIERLANNYTGIAYEITLNI